MKIAISAPLDTGSGGDFYNRRMVRALRQAGHEAVVLAPDADVPAGDAWVRVVDGRTLQSLGPITVQSAYALIHHPAEAHRDMLPHFAGVIAAGEATYNALLATHGVDPAKLRVVPPGADHGPRSPGSGGRCQILSIGALTPRKQYDMLLRALARLGDLEWRLTIVGAPHDATYAASLPTLAAELSIAWRVRLAGAVDDTALEALWASADLMALASRWEPHGTAAADALGRGVPVAVSPEAAVGVTIPPDSGIVCGDEELLSRGLRRLIYDTELRAAFRDGAWQTGQALPGWADRARDFADALLPA